MPPPPPRRPLRPPPGIARPVVPIPVSPAAPIAPSVTPVSPITTPLVPVVVPAITLAPTAPSRARFEALIAELHRLRGEMNRNVHRCGTILTELSTPAMLAFGEVTDFGKLLERYELPSRWSAMKFMTIAEHFTEAQVVSLGLERAYLIVRGAAALPRPIAPGVLLTQNPTIRVGPDVMKLAAAPLRSLLGWVNGLEQPSAPAPDLKRAAKAADSLRDKLQRRFVSAAIGKPKMQVRQRGSAYVVKVELTMDEAAALLSAVRKAP